MPSIRGRAAQVAKPNSPFQLVEKEFPEPGPWHVRIRVQACGVCHSDVLTKAGYWPGIAYPRVPGHEVAGVIESVGPNVHTWKVGQRVGVGWHGGHCFYCDRCRRGDFVTCRNQQISGISLDGGYADYMIVPANALALIPDELSAVDAGPLMCAGITTFNSLRNSGARAGDLVAVHGIGGLGHLGVQFAVRAGFRTVAIARGQDKAPLAKKLGAHVYLDSQKQDVAAELTKLGGATIILATVTDAKAMESVIGGLGVGGKLLVVGAPGEPMQVAAAHLIGKRLGIQAWPSGTAQDSEDTLNFSAMTGVRPMTETFPLEKAEDAFAWMISGQARFRVVITTGA